jgi:hypothetical protein
MAARIWLKTVAQGLASGLVGPILSVALLWYLPGVFESLTQPSPTQPSNDIALLTAWLPVRCLIAIADLGLPFGVMGVLVARVLRRHERALARWGAVYGAVGGMLIGLYALITPIKLGEGFSLPILNIEEAWRPVIFPLLEIVIGAIPGALLGFLIATRARPLREAQLKQ